jgi:hypothetical protein
LIILVKWRDILKNIVNFTIIFLITLGILCISATADRLPNQTPENQVFSTVSSVEAIGSYSGSQNLQWTNGNDPVTNRTIVMHVYASGTPAPMSDVDYNTLHQILTNGGGSDDGSKNGIWQVNVMDIPQDLLSTPFEFTTGGTTYHTLQDFAHGYFEIGYTPGSHEIVDSFSLSGHNGLHTGTLDPVEVRSTTAYNEMTQTNGGYISETKSFDPDSRDKATGLFNVESTKTLTYETDANTGSIAQTSESVTMDNMANTDLTSDVVACPFGPSSSFYYPAFCNVVYAKSMSQGVTSAAMSSSAQVRTVTATADVPAGLNYNFDVKPDASSDVGYAMGTFGTEFGVSIREARGNNLTPSALNVYTDSATVTGMVAKFTKQYAYKSGFRL